MGEEYRKVANVYLKSCFIKVWAVLHTIPVMDFHYGRLYGGGYAAPEEGRVLRPFGGA